MLIAGAKGFAKQLLDVLFQLHLESELAFFDDYHPDLNSFYHYEVLKNEASVRAYFEKSGPLFSLGVGGPINRHILKNKLTELGGELASIISPDARIAAYAKTGAGVSILTGSVIENDVELGEGVLVNLKASVCHESFIGNYVEISPGAIITGNCTIGDFTFIGAGAVVSPKVKIGKNVIIGAGAVVTRNIEDNSVAVGVPAVVIKSREPLTFV